MNEIIINNIYNTNYAHSILTENYIIVQEFSNKNKKTP